MSQFTLRTTDLVSVTTVASSASSVSLISANTKRKGLTIQNTSTAILYALLGGGTATATTAHSVQIPSNGYYEVPYGFTGAVSGIWASANGSANITEFL
jgi:hypothetical protein